MSEIAKAHSILVPIDMYGIDLSKLETLVRIARRLDRNVLGLILEDDRLRQVADLPFTTEIVLDSGRERGLLRHTLERQHNNVALDTRRRLTELTIRHGIELHFVNATGARLRAALDREEHSDVFFPARQHWRPTALASTVRLGLVQMRGEQSERVLDMAKALSSAHLVSEIYVLAQGGFSSDQLRYLSSPGIRISVQSSPAINSDSMTRLIRGSPYDLLLLPRDALMSIAPEILDAALDDSRGQVLLVV